VISSAPPVAQATARRWTQDPPREWPGDARALADRLAKSVAGDVRFDAGHRALYAVDGSNYRQVPMASSCRARSTT